MKNLFVLSVAVLLLVSCEKDPVSKSEHPFSDKQQKAVETFVGSWEQYKDLFILHPDTLVFGRSADTNVVVREYSYMDGWVEKFQYQGEVVLREYSYAVSKYVDVPCWWYVNYSAERLELWRRSDSVRVWDKKLKIQSASHFSCISTSSSSGTWSQFYKI